MKYLMFSLVILISCCQGAKAREYSAGWELWYPYQYHNTKGKLVGVDIQAFDAIMKAANLSYTMAEIPWKTHLLYVKTGKVDMAMGASWSEDRCAYAYFSLPYRTETVKLFVKKGQVDRVALKSLDDLIGSPYIIGVESGYYYGERYAELIKRKDFFTNISEAIDLEQNVTLLLDGHLDGLLADPFTMEAFMDKYDMRGQFEPHSMEIYGTHISIILSKASTSPKTLERINKSIEQLRTEGVLEVVSAVPQQQNDHPNCQTMDR